jgi:hypothetical protein
MAAMASQAAFAVKTPDGMWASGPLVTSAKTCSTSAWSRCCPSAWMSSNGESEDRVVAPGGEQLVLPGGCFLVQVADPADDQPGDDGLALL